MYTLPAPGGICGLWLAEELSANGYATTIDAISYYPPASIIIDGLPEDPETVEAVQAIVDSHDPVSINAERTGDDVTVTLSKLNNVDEAAFLTLTIDDEAAPDPSVLVDNVATVQIVSPDEITIGIVENYSQQEVTI